MLKIKPITASETHAIRHTVLRPGRPIEECIFDGDEDKKTIHLGAFINQDLIGIASFVVDHKDYFTGKQYRLRGMAVLPEYRKKGYGKKLVSHGEKLLHEQGINTLWFNAREVALHFYNGLGFMVKGKPFEIETVGTHYVMYKVLT